MSLLILWIKFSFIKLIHIEFVIRFQFALRIEKHLTLYNMLASCCFPIFVILLHRFFFFFPVYIDITNIFDREKERQNIIDKHTHTQKRRREKKKKQAVSGLSYFPLHFFPMTVSIDDIVYIELAVVVFSFFCFEIKSSFFWGNHQRSFDCSSTVFFPFFSND